MAAHVREGESERVHARRRTRALEDLVRDRRPRGPSCRAGPHLDPDVAERGTPPMSSRSPIRGVADPRRRAPRDARGRRLVGGRHRSRAPRSIRRFTGVDRAPVELDTILSTVLFTDIVGSTEKQASLGDHGWKELVERHHAVVRDALGRWRGVENDTAGDGFYATFDGPARAIRCAQEVGTSGQRSRDRDPRRRAHGRVRGDRRQDRRSVRLDRSPRGLERRSLRSADLPDGEGPGRREADSRSRTPASTN